MVSQSSSLNTANIEAQETSIGKQNNRFLFLFCPIARFLNKCTCKLNCNDEQMSIHLRQTDAHNFRTCISLRIQKKKNLLLFSLANLARNYFSTQFMSLLSYRTEAIPEKSVFYTLVCNNYFTCIIYQPWFLRNIPNKKLPAFIEDNIFLILKFTQENAQHPPVVEGY